MANTACQIHALGNDHTEEEGYGRNRVSKKKLRRPEKEGRRGGGIKFRRKK